MAEFGGQPPPITTATSSSASAASASAGTPEQTGDVRGEGHAQRNSRPEATTQMKEAKQLLFGVEKSLRYHQRRQAYFERWHRGAMFLVILIGSSAFATPYPGLAGLLAAALAALDLAYGPGVRGCEHARLRHDFTRLAVAIKCSTDPTETDLHGWTTERMMLEAGEPPVYWAVEADCYNEMLRAIGDETETPNKIDFQYRILKHLIRFEGTNFAPSGS